MSDTRKLRFTMLDVRRLHVLREFAVRGTVAAAAGALGYTPSAVSQQLAQLEREAGVALFRRVGRRLELTEAGARLVAHADAVVERLAEAEADLAAHAGDVRGTVRVAAFQLAALELVLPALPRLAREHPDLRVELLEAGAETSLPLVASGRLDIAVAEEYEHAPRPRVPQLDRVGLGPDEMLLVLPHDHPAATPHDEPLTSRRGDQHDATGAPASGEPVSLSSLPGDPRDATGAPASGEPVSLSSLRDEAWATAGEGTAYAEMVAGLCRAVGGFEPAIRHRVDDFRLLLELVAQGGAVALLPALGRPQDDPRVAVRRLAEGAFPRSIFLAVRRVDRARPATAAVVAALASTAGART